MSAPLLVGGLALAVDVAYWRHRLHQMQINADATAVSGVLDLAAGINTHAVLLSNARAEAFKNGCAANCSVVVNWPFGGDATAAEVIVTDNSPARFFSGIYEPNGSSRVLRGRSVVQRAVAGGPGGAGANAGSACILALQGSGTGILVRNSGTSVEGCEIVANSSSGGAITIDASGVVATRASTPGTIVAMNGGFIAPANRNPGSNAIADPYAGFVADPVNGRPLRRGQFLYVGPGNGWRQAECLERVDVGGNIQPIGLWGSGSIAAQLFSPTLAGYSYANVGGRHVHRFQGGGGRFCAAVNLASSADLDLGSGVYYFNSEVNFNDARILATDTTNRTINAMIPSVGGRQTNGVTLVLGANNVNLGNSTVFRIRGPTTGPLSGIAWADYADAVSGSNWEFSNTVNIQWQGVMYIPQRFLRVQNSGFFSSLPPAAGGTSADGCSQIVARQIEFSRDVQVANNCASLGMVAFGNGVTGWNSGGGGPSVPARLVQ